MNINETSCCAVQELEWIQNASPRNIIRAVYRDAITEIYNGYTLTYENQLELKAFYIFTAVKNVKRGGGRYIRTGYGQRLANFIKKHKLGTVTKSPARLNRTSHPDHQVEVFVWAPSLRGMKAYCKDIQKTL